MKTSSAQHIISDRWIKRSPKGHYYSTLRLVGRLVNLSQGPRRKFARQILKNQAQFLLGSIESVSNQLPERTKAAMEWLLRAYEAAGEGGVSYGYFPCDIKDRAGGRLTRNRQATLFPLFSNTPGVIRTRMCTRKPSRWLIGKSQCRWNPGRSREE